MDTSGEVTLVDDDSIGQGGRDERQAIRDAGPGRVVVEDDEGQGVAEDGNKQSQVSRCCQSVMSTPAQFGAKVTIPGSTYPTNQANLLRVAD